MQIVLIFSEKHEGDKPKMKRFIKIIALMLSLFMIIPMAVSAGANPDLIVGSINYGVGNYVVMANDNYFGIYPGHAIDDGFGTSNPLGLAKMGPAWYAQATAIKQMPLFEMLAYDRTKGAFNPGTLLSLTPSVDGTALKYNFPDQYGFSYKPGEQVAADAFYAHPSEKYTPVVSFTAPTDGVYTWSMTFTRQYRANTQTDANHPLTNGMNGTQLKFYKNHDQIRRFVVNDNSPRHLTVSTTLNRGDVIYLEFDPVHNNIGADGFTVTDLRVYIDQHYTGELDAEYDNSGQKPLQSFAFMSDLHTDENIMLDKNEPVYGTVTNAFKFIKDRGNVDAVFFAGDIISDNAHHDNVPEYKYSYWTPQNIDWTLTHIFTEGKKATEGGNGKVFAVAGNHDKDAGYVAAHDKTTNAYVKANDIFHTDYYTRYTSKNEYSGAASKVLHYNDMWKYVDGGKAGDFNSYYNEVLCYRYNVGGIEIIGISQARCNNPATSSDPQKSLHNCQGIYPAQSKWVVEQLEEIGKDKTVIIMSHYNMNDMRIGADLTAGNILTDAFEEYTNVIYVYGHVHHGGNQTEAWYNTVERIQTLGDRVQLDDGSYATNGWHYAYIGGMWNTEYNKSYAQDSTTAQITTIDFYNDHITIQAHNVGTDYVGNKVLTSYTIKREMKQLTGYKGNGSGNVTVPESNKYAENQQYVPKSVSSVKNTYTMNLGINKLSNGQFKLTGIYDPTFGKLRLSDKATATSWSAAYVEHRANGVGLIVSTQAPKEGGLFDMRAEVGYSSAMVFTAPAAGAYGYSTDMIKVSPSAGQVTVRVMKGAKIIKELLPKDITKEFKVSGNVYLEAGEDLRIVVSKYDFDSRTSGNEVAVKNFVVKQYGKYTMPVVESGGSNTGTGACVHTGGTASCNQKAICTKCGQPYGSYNMNNHASNKVNKYITDGTHKATYVCCGTVVIPEGSHSFVKGKCNVCSFICDHDGYMQDGKCLNCDPSVAGMAPPSSNTPEPEVSEDEITVPDNMTDPDDVTEPEDTEDIDDTTVPDVSSDENGDKKGKDDGGSDGVSPIVVYIIVAVVAVAIAGAAGFIIIKKAPKKK
ncbi:MAG: metallophosphoesterase [Ruminococcaceae bacterium]|nr:metallophosphoesterase [Oscillospiraceae bacterium]